MRASSSSSSSSLSLSKRLKTIFKKAEELSILCQVAVCVIYYAPNGELKTWPEREIVQDMALRYKAATKRKKSVSLQDFMEGKLENDKNPMKKRKRESVNVKYQDWYSVFDHYTPNQLHQLVLSLEGTFSTLQERLRFLEAQKQRNTNLVHHQHQTGQSLNPSQFSLYRFNRDDATTLSQLQLINYQNQLMMQQQRLYGFDHKITNTNIQQPCVSNTQDHPALLSVQESRLKNQLMQQQELYGSHHNTNGNVIRNPCPLNTVPKELSSDLDKNPDGDMVGRPWVSQDFPILWPAYDENGQLQTSSLPYLHQTIPNRYLGPDNSRCL